jgi:hypothetical protein
MTNYEIEKNPDGMSGGLIEGPPCHLSEGTQRTHETLVRKAAVTAEIRTEHFRNTSLERCI